MVPCIDGNRDDHGVEPTCQQLPIAPSTYYDHKARFADPGRLPKRIKRGLQLEIEIRRVYEDNFRAYGARKVWRQMTREGVEVARCGRAADETDWSTGVRRGAKRRTAISDAAQQRPLDLVNRQFTATRPNQLWVADLTFVATWPGFAYVAFVIDVFARYIVGWRVSRSLQADLVPDALEQAPWSRKRRDTEDLIHHGDRGSQYLSIRYSGRLEEVNILPSVGSVGDSYDNALAETTNGLYKTEVIRHRGPWKQVEDVEYATLEWVGWFNHRRLLEPTGYVSPVEYEMRYYESIQEPAKAA
jgi:transposase InsO family protein